MGASIVADARCRARAIPGRHQGSHGRGGQAPAERSALLLETSIRHGAFEAVAPPHDWWDWYAAHMVAREGGGEPDNASVSAGRYMADVKHHVVPAGRR